MKRVRIRQTGVLEADKFSDLLSYHKENLYNFDILLLSCNFIKRKYRSLCDRITHAILKFLLLAGIPTGNILKVTGYPADLHHIMRTTFRTDGFATERAVLDTRYNLMVAVAVVKGTHDFKVRLTAVGTWLLIDNEVTGVALVFTLIFRNFIDSFEFICQVLLFCGPIHSITSHNSLINI